MWTGGYDTVQEYFRLTVSSLIIKKMYKYAPDTSPIRWWMLGQVS